MRGSATIVRLASLSTLLTAAGRTFRRFPATLLSAIVAGATAMHLIGRYPAPDRLLHLLMVAALGIPLFTALRLFGEKPPSGRPLPRSWIPMVAAAAALLLYGYLLDHEDGEGRYLRYFQISLALHLAVALAPFLGRGETNGFWQFNRRLFLRSFLSAIYAGVFFCGLALALVAVDQLFELRINEKVYFRLWLFTVFVFQTWHFLGGVPSDLADLDRDRQHPRALEIFCQYMLVPLVVIYVAILYAYMGKILLTRQWPQGWVGWLVSSAAVFGVLTLLLLHPGREEKDNRWMEMFGRAYYIAVLPLIGLLFAALGKRIGPYGMTERRYFLLVLGLWLAGVALYMLFSRAKSIKTVPATLAVTALVTACGPWGAYGTALRSQTRRLESLLTKHGLLSDGRVVASRAPVGEADLKELSAILDYLVANHGAGRLNRWDGKDWAAVAAKIHGWDRASRVSTEFLAAIGLEYTPRWGRSENHAYYSSRQDQLDIAGYERLVHAEFNRGQGGGSGSRRDPGRYSARLAERGQVLEVLKGPAVVLTQPLVPLLRRLQDGAPQGGQAMPGPDLCLDTAGASLRARLCLTILEVEKEADGELSVRSGSGYLLIGPKP